MDTIILEDFRCFAGRHEVPVRPLTLLVGENSTGKTSFLAAVRTLYMWRNDGIADFNLAPFQLGAFTEIASFRGERAGRPQEFRLGFIQNNFSVTTSPTRF